MPTNIWVLCKKKSRKIHRNLPHVSSLINLGMNDICLTDGYVVSMIDLTCTSLCCTAITKCTTPLKCKVQLCLLISYVKQHMLIFFLCAHYPWALKTRCTSRPSTDKTEKVNSCSFKERNSFCSCLSGCVLHSFAYLWIYYRPLVTQLVGAWTIAPFMMCGPFVLQMPNT